MTQGDSITQGVGADPGTGGYRAPLYRMFPELVPVGHFHPPTEAVVLTEFPEKSNTDGRADVRGSAVVLSETALTWSEGHGHLILIHIGTNDLGGDDSVTARNIGAIVDYFRAQTDPKPIVFVARIVNPRPGSSYMTAWASQTAAVVAEMAHHECIVVEMPMLLDSEFYSTPAINVLHPNQAGYDRIATAWANALSRIRL